MMKNSVNNHLYILLVPILPHEQKRRFYFWGRISVSYSAILERRSFVPVWLILLRGFATHQNNFIFSDALQELCVYQNTSLEPDVIAYGLIFSNIVINNTSDDS